MRPCRSSLPRPAVLLQGWASGVRGARRVYARSLVVAQRRTNERVRPQLLRSVTVHVARRHGTANAGFAKG
jgi:hypothetical protein